MFEKASRLKLRFDTPAGVLSVEDLWDLPLTSRAGHANLDDIAKDLSRQVSSQEESFVEKPAPKKKGLDLAFEIVKHVIKIRLEERDALKAAEAKKARKTKILEIMARKQDQALEEMDMADLEKELEGL